MCANMRTVHPHGFARVSSQHSRRSSKSTPTHREMVEKKRGTGFLGTAEQNAEHDSTKVAISADSRKSTAAPSHSPRASN